VPEGRDEGANEELQYVDIAQDQDQSPEGPKAIFASEGKPRIINLSFKTMQLYIFFMIVHLRFRS
jgi:hypothetical protein